MGIIILILAVIGLGAVVRSYEGQYREFLGALIFCALAGIPWLIWGSDVGFWVLIGMFVSIFIGLAIWVKIDNEKSKKKKSKKAL